MVPTGAILEVNQKLVVFASSFTGTHQDDHTDSHDIISCKNGAWGGRNSPQLVNEVHNLRCMSALNLADLRGADVRAAVAAPQVDAETIQTAVGAAGRVWYVATAPRHRASTLSEKFAERTRSVDQRTSRRIKKSTLRPMAADGTGVRGRPWGVGGAQRACPTAARGTCGHPSRMRTVPVPSATRRARIQRSAEMKSGRPITPRTTLRHPLRPAKHLS